MKRIELNVTGMSCTGCEQRIQTTLARLAGVVRSRADHRTGVVSVVLDPVRASEDGVRAAIERAGYGVS